MKLNCIFRVAEELFPFVSYRVHSRRLLLRCDADNIVNYNDFAEYDSLSNNQLKHRLNEERQRAAAMDEKTFKLTLSISVALTILGSIAALVTKEILSATVQVTLLILFTLGLIYVLVAGLTAVGALRTQRSFGYGTRFLLEQERQEGAQRVLADALARQETMNRIRHLRNETAYQALRNGLLMLFLGILIFLVTLTYQSLRSAPDFSDSTCRILHRSSIGPSSLPEEGQWVDPCSLLLSIGTVEKPATAHRWNTLRTAAISTVTRGRRIQS